MGNGKSISASEIDSLEDVKLWVADHDGAGTQRDVVNRLTSLEKKVIWLAAAAAAGGSVAPDVVKLLVGF